MLLSRFYLCIALCAASAVLASCSTHGSASCKETCSTDNDCASDLICASSDKICVPSNCKTCWDDKKSCFYTENTEAQANGDKRECTFSECQ